MRYAMYILPTIASLIAISAHADIPEIIACANQTDPKLRLACYDAAAAKLKAQFAEEQSRKLSLFGFTLPSIGGSDADAKSEPAPVTAKVTGSRDDGVGHVILTLDNGEVWKVQDQTLVPINAARSKGVVISKNLLGGFYLSVAGQQNNLSVIRVQ
jgi:hypothetical protein